MNRINKFREICDAIQSKAKSNAIKEYSNKYFIINRIQEGT